MTQLRELDELLNSDSDNCAVVESGAEMAAVLHRASPGQARSFALCMHERACVDDDETALAFWCYVLESLTLSGPPNSAVAKR